MRRALNPTLRHRDKISIHAPKYGATLSSFPPKHRVLYFNPRTQVWCDVRAILDCPRLRSDFNPRTQVWCDAFGLLPGRGQGSFNPRTQVWCDMCMAPDCRRHYKCFNPRTQVWCDPATGPGLSPSDAISIHAPKYGATHKERGINGIKCNFNPRTQVGCDSKS